MLIPFWAWQLCKGSYILPSGLSKPHFDICSELWKHLLSDWNASGLVSVWSLIVLESLNKFFSSVLIFGSGENECLLESLAIVITVSHWGCAGSRFPLAGSGAGGPSCPFCLSSWCSVSSLSCHLGELTGGAAYGGRVTPWQGRGVRELAAFHANSSVP